MVVNIPSSFWWQRTGKWRFVWGN